MATELATAYISLVPSFKGVQGEIARGLAPVTGAAGAAGKKSGQAYGSGMKLGVGKIAGLLGAGFAAVKVKDFLGDSIAEARESQKVGALTTQVIKSTGGAAKVTAADVGRLATSISNKSGMDDEAIQTGANLLLTFKNIRNEAGKGNKIFDQATQAAVDLSAAGFGSVDSASKQLGKALNDPLKGITALGRSGVTFSEDQKKLIKGFVAQGDMLSAQKIILGEVKSQVGGAAAASATAGEKLAVSWGNFKETIGTALLPLIDKLAVFIGGRLLPAVLRMGPTFQKWAGAIKAVSDILFKGDFTRRFRQIFHVGEDSKAVDILFRIRETVLALVAAFKANLPQIKATFASVFTDIRSIITSTVSFLKILWGSFGQTLTAYARAAFTNLMTIIGGALTIIRGIFKTVAALLRGDWKGVWDGIKLILSGAWTVIRGIVSQGWNILRTTFKLAGTALKILAGAAWDGIKATFKAGISGIISLIKSVPGLLKGYVGLWKGAGKALINGLLSGIKGASGFIGDLAGSIWGHIKTLLNGAIRSINSKLNINLPGPGGKVSLPKIPLLAKGGIVTRPTLAVIGEAGPEAVVPLKGRHAPVIGNANGGGVTNHFHITAPQGLDEPQLADTLASRVLWKMTSA